LPGVFFGVFLGVLLGVLFGFPIRKSLASKGRPNAQNVRNHVRL
jgi:hypothetical protein